MTRDEKLDALQACIIRDGDMESAAALASVRAELDEERKDCVTALSRAEQAEKELDEARSERHMQWREKLDAIAALVRAEADNAVLLALANERGCLDLGPSMGRERSSSCNDQGWADDESCPACRSTRTPHPGAALLEYVRALEKVRDAVVNAHGQDRLGEDETTKVIMSLIHVADAMKERKS